MATVNKKDSKRKKRLQVSEGEQWDAITSPARFEIYTFLEGSGPCSIAELADLLDVAADGLYHHIKILVAAGLIQETGFRKSGRQIESIYDVVASELQFDLESGHSAERLTKLNDAVLRQCSRNLKAAVESGEAVFKGANRNSFNRLETAWLSREEVAEVREHIEAITRIFNEGRKQRNGQLMMACCNLSPVIRSRRSNSK